MPLLPRKSKRATTRQVDYIQGLGIDLGLNSAQILAHAKDIAKVTDIKFLDELTLDEASDVITKFKQWKLERKERERRTAEDLDWI